MPLRHQLDEQLRRMSEEFLGMQDTVAQQVRALRDAVANGQCHGLQARISELDAEVDRADQRVEQEALKLLALHAPVAHDLRYALLMMQSAPDLERSGDYAKHLARLLDGRDTTWPGDEHLEAALKLLADMAGHLRAASFPMSADRAAHVAELDARMDALHDQVQAGLLHPTESMNVQGALNAAQLWRSAERLGDHLKNVSQRITRLHHA